VKSKVLDRIRVAILLIESRVQRKRPYGNSGKALYIHVKKEKINGRIVNPHGVNSKRKKQALLDRSRLGGVVMDRES